MHACLSRTLISIAVGRSIVLYTQNTDKMYTLDENKLIACAGPQADRVHFCEYIQRNIALYTYRTNVHLSTKATANFARNELAEALRSKPYEANVLIAGFDNEKPQLFYLDYLASMHEVSVGAHGYAGYFAYSLFDRYWRKDMDLEEGKDCMKKILAELEARFLLGVKSVSCRVVDKDGIRLVDL